MRSNGIEKWLGSRWIAAFALCIFVSTAAAQEPVRLYAAGSLRSAFTALTAAFTAATGVKVATTFGASGLLRERIERGEAAEVFASADMGNPQKLATADRAESVTLFTRNRLCALASSKMNVTSENLLDRMLDPMVKLGTSTPKADPNGDYAWQLFEKAEKRHPGAFAKLSTKALQLTGGPDSPPPPKDLNVYGMRVAGGDADIFLTYCTNALQAKREQSSLQIVQLPEALAVGADYGLTIIKGARPDAFRLARFLLSSEQSGVLLRHGFSLGGGR